jgi:hypothetical protein
MRIKTKYFPLLPEEGEVVFCARPRRFGKSLTVSALDAFFSGRKELFQGRIGGRGIHEFTRIHLDLSEAGDCKCKRCGLIEKLLPDTINLTDEQF